MKSEWVSVTLGNLCNISSSKRIFAKEYCKIGIPFYRGKEIIEKHKGNPISTELFISEERYEEIKRNHDVPLKGDILLTSVGTLGVPWLVDENNFYFKDGNLILLRVGKKLDNKFLYFWLCSSEAKHQIDSKCIGSTQKALTIEALGKFDICIPPIDVQRKIASVLSSIDRKIAINTAINNNLEQQAQAIFKSWFVDFEPFGGVMPDDWKIGELFEIADIASGKRPPIKLSEKSVEFSIPLVGASSVMGYTNNYNYSSRIIVIGRVGTHGIVQRFNIPCWASDNTLVITSDYYEYVYQILKTVDYTNLNRGSTQPLITQGDMRKVSVVIPTIQILQKYEDIMFSIMGKYEHNNVENKHLAALRDTLLPKLMNGEIDVSNVKI